MPEAGADGGDSGDLWRTVDLPVGLFVSRNYAEVSPTVYGGYQITRGPYEDGMGDVDKIKIYWGMSSPVDCSFVVRVRGRWK